MGNKINNESILVNKAWERDNAEKTIKILDVETLFSFEKDINKYNPENINNCVRISLAGIFEKKIWTKLMIINRVEIKAILRLNNSLVKKKIEKMLSNEKNGVA